MPAIRGQVKCDTDGIGSVAFTFICSKFPIDRAQAEEDQPIPVMFELSIWKNNQSQVAVELSIELIYGLQDIQTKIKNKTIPNQGMWESAKNVATIFLITINLN